jgi:hypothetical protein
MTSIVITPKSLAGVINDLDGLRKTLLIYINNNDTLLLKGFDKTERYHIYRTMYNPLKFEKILEDDDNVTIKINKIKIYRFNKKNKDNLNKLLDIKESNEQGNEEDNEEGNEQDNEEDDEEENEEENEEDNDEDDETYIGSDSDSDEVNETFEFYTKIETILNEVELDTKKLILRTNIAIGFAVVGWSILLLLDPIRLIVNCKEDIIM